MVRADISRIQTAAADDQARRGFWGKDYVRGVPENFWQLGEAPDASSTWTDLAGAARGDKVGEETSPHSGARRSKAKEA